MMMRSQNSILVVGSVAIDSVQTPFGKRERAIGGSATYFSLAARFFNKVNIVAVVGEDFPRTYRSLFSSRGIGIDGLETKPGKTFRWKGSYQDDINTATTIYTHLNVFKDFSPVIPRHLARERYVFLANIDPDIQADVLSQIRDPRFIACDTMNYWIANKRRALVRVLKKVDLCLLNDGEARMLSGEDNLIAAARWVIASGPKMVVIKKGEHGVFYASKRGCFLASAFPLLTLRDPTGAGDSFAGGMFGYISAAGSMSEGTVKKGIIYGSVLGSFCVEEFSVDRLLKLTRNLIEKRYNDFRKMTWF